jgi:hypothetical protein
MDTHRVDAVVRHAKRYPVAQMERNLWLKNLTLMNLVLLVASALAHFELVEPKGRKVDEMTADQGPCGQAPPQERVKIPTKGLLIATTIFHRNTTLNYRLSLAQNPTKQEEFTEVYAPELVVARASTVRTTPLDFETIRGVGNNVNATLQIRSVDYHSIMYQCIDVTFVKQSTNSASTLSSAAVVSALISLLL